MSMSEAVSLALGGARADSLVSAHTGKPQQRRLTERETEVLQLVAHGKSNREIALELVLSIRTVERHIENLYAKIGATGRAGATAYALRHSLA